MEADKPKPKAPPRRANSTAPASPTTEAAAGRDYKENRREPLSDEERERCIELCQRLLALRHHQGEIKRAVAATLKMEPRSVEPYITEARKRNAASMLGRSTQELVNESYRVYEAIIADPLAEPKDKIRAQNSIDQLLGLRQPIKIAHTDPTGRKEAGRDVKNLTTEELLQAEALLGKMRGRGEPSRN